MLLLLVEEEKSSWEEEEEEEGEEGGRLSITATKATDGLDLEEGGEIATSKGTSNPSYAHERRDAGLRSVVTSVVIIHR